MSLITMQYCEYRQIDRQTDKQTDRQTDRQTGNIHSVAVQYKCLVLHTKGQSSILRFQGFVKRNISPKNRPRSPRVGEDVVGGQSHASAALPPGKAWYRRLDGMREQV
jgi:hypothetical protein